MWVLFKDALECGVYLGVIGLTLVKELTDGRFMIMYLPIEHPTREIEPTLFLMRNDVMRYATLVKERF